MPKRLSVLTLLLLAASACTTQRVSPSSTAPASAPATTVPLTSAHSAQPSIIFFSGTAAQNEIINDTMEPYFSRLQLPEMEMKTGKLFPEGTLDQQRAECRLRFQNGVVEPSPEEKALLM